MDPIAVAWEQVQPEHLFLVGFNAPKQFNIVFHDDSLAASFQCTTVSLRGWMRLSPIRLLFAFPTSCVDNAGLRCKAAGCHSFRGSTRHHCSSSVAAPGRVGSGASHRVPYQSCPQIGTPLCACLGPHA